MSVCLFTKAPISPFQVPVWWWWSWWWWLRWGWGYHIRNCKQRKILFCFLVSSQDETLCQLFFFPSPTLPTNPEFGNRGKDTNINESDHVNYNVIESFKKRKKCKLQCNRLRFNANQLSEIKVAQFQVNRLWLKEIDIKKNSFCCHSCKSIMVKETLWSISINLVKWFPILISQSFFCCCCNWPRGWAFIREMVNVSHLSTLACPKTRG